MVNVGSFAKALVAAIAAGVGTLAQAMADGVIVQGEWITIGLAVAGALGITYAVPNAKKSDGQ